MPEKILVMLMPHFDDEIFNGISFLLNYPREIHLFISHEGDCISEESYSRNTCDFFEVIGKLNDYRKERGYSPIIVGGIPLYSKEVVDRLSIKPDWHEDLCSRLEKILISEGRVEYFIIPSPSIHQSHTQSHNIGKSMLRPPYLDNIDEVLVGTYQVDVRAPNTLLSEDCVFNPIKFRDLPFIVDLLNTYKKNALPSSELEVIFRYNGFRCGEDYAQVFHPVYRKLQFK